MKSARFLSVILAAALQVMPFLRAVIPLQAQGFAPSAWAIVLKLATGAVTLLGYHAVSAATAIVQPYTVNGTNGKAILRQLGTSGQTAHSWSTTTAPLGSASFPLVPGVTLSSGGLIKGTPTQAGTNTFAITAWEFAGNSGRNITATFTFNIASAGTPPSLVTNLQNTIVAQGSNITLTVTANGPPPLTYLWTFNGTTIKNAITNSMTVTNAQATNGGTYKVTVSNAGGSVSSSAIINVVTPPLIVAPMQDAIVTAGGTATLNPGIGGGSATFLWLRNNTLLPDAISLPLTLSNLDPTQSGLYTLVLSNIAGVVSNSAQLLVVSPANAANAPQLNTLSLNGNQEAISFTTMAGYNYEIQFTADLTSVWTTLTNFPATFTPIQISLPLQQPTSNGFYRVLMSN